MNGDKKEYNDEKLISTELVFINGPQISFNSNETISFGQYVYRTQQYLTFLLLNFCPRE